MNLEYRVVDVFTQTPLEGNPLAVFPSAQGIDGSTMQRIARELSLSETTFILPAETSEGAAKVRIFTPTRELQFAGHPTIGTAFLMRELGIVPPDASHFVVEEGIGPVRVRVDESDDTLLWLTTPPITRGDGVDAALCARMLGIADSDLIAHVQPRFYGAGNVCLFVALGETAAVDRCALDATAFTRLAGSTADVAPCVFVFAPTPGGAYSRMFAPLLGIIEDPATGSATGPLAAFMLDAGLAPRSGGTRFTSEQGTKMGRRSLLHVLINREGGNGSIEVGGHVVPIISATMSLR